MTGLTWCTEAHLRIVNREVPRQVGGRRCTSRKRMPTFEARLRRGDTKSRSCRSDLKWRPQIMTDTEAKILLLYIEVILFGTFKQYLKHNLCNIHESLIFLNSLKKLDISPIFLTLLHHNGFYWVHNVHGNLSLQTAWQRDSMTAWQHDSMTSASHNFSTKFFFTNYFQALIWMSKHSGEQVINCTKELYPRQ